jgi:hypothetical protein
MDKLLKLFCEHRKHQDYNKPAECSKFQELTGIHATFDQSACQYCLDTKPTFEITSEPFASKYHRLSIDGAIQPSFQNANCILLGEPIDQPSDVIDSTDYLKLKHRCCYYGQCTITPQGIANCQTCPGRLRIDYKFNENPDFGIYNCMPKFGTIRKWAVGITTSVRKNPTIVKTVKSLEHAGWDAGVIFAEPESYIDCGLNWSFVHRFQQIGIFGNWMLGLYELFIRNIDADAFLMMQDDIIIAPNTREYLENALWFTDGPHLVSLLGPNAADKDPSDGWRSAFRYSGGPQALIMSHETVQEILTSLIPLRYYGIQHMKKTSFDDLGIFSLTSNKKWPIYYPKPSIGDHIGHQSTHCQQSTKWTYPDRVLCNHQYYDVEHWYITNNRMAKSDLSELRGILQRFNNVNWLIIDDETEPLSYLKEHCNSEWIITTELPIGTVLLSDIRHEIIKHFSYNKQWLKFGFGSVDGKYVYTENGPCKTLCERSDDLVTCLSDQRHEDDCYVVKGKPFWSTDAIRR